MVRDQGVPRVPEQDPGARAAEAARRRQRGVQPFRRYMYPLPDRRSPYPGPHGDEQGVHAHEGGRLPAQIGELLHPEGVINRVWQAVERCERRSLADGELHVPRIKTPPRFRSICFDPKSSKIENSRIRLNRDRVSVAGTWPSPGTAGRWP